MTGEAGQAGRVDEKAGVKPVAIIDTEPNRPTGNRAGNEKEAQDFQDPQQALQAMQGEEERKNFSNLTEKKRFDARW